MIEVKRFINNPISSNCFVVFDKAKGLHCIIIDPGSEIQSELFEYLDSYNLVPEFIILTHEHFDHCWGVNGLREKYNDIKLVCSSECSSTMWSAGKPDPVLPPVSGNHLLYRDYHPW